MNKTDTAKDQDGRLTVSPAPHLHSENTTQKIMFMVCLALLLPTAGGVYYFGVYSLIVVLVSVVTAVLTEYISKMLRKREFIMDGSAIVTGMLLALVMPPRIPLWVVVIGSAFAIAIVKEAFGGLGYNIFNPALAARAFLSITFTGLMTKWVAPVSSRIDIDSSTTATPLSESFVKSGSTNDLYWDLFLGDVGGCIGETSALLVLIGGLLLLITGVIKWRIPFVYIGTVFLLTWIIPGEDPIFHILAGGLFLGAFFMATDYVTVPLTDKGQFIFAAGAGILVVLIRLYGSMPEGVAFSILLMNSVTPLIDRYVRPEPYGYVPPEKPDEDEGEDKREEDSKKEDKPKKDGSKEDEGGKSESEKEEGADVKEKEEDENERRSNGDVVKEEGSVNGTAEGERANAEEGAAEDEPSEDHIKVTSEEGAIDTPEGADMDYLWEKGKNMEDEDTNGGWNVMRMDDPNFKEEVFPILFLTIVVCVSVIALSIIDSITKDKIEEAKQQEIDDMLEEQFPEMEESDFMDEIDVYSILANDTVIGYAFMIEGSGYGGAIEILVALENTTLAEDDIILRGISIISNSETPGLGEKITEADFLAQFQGIDVRDVRLKEDGGKIDAISGATISSSAVVDAIYDEVQIKAEEILEFNDSEEGEV